MDDEQIKRLENRLDEILHEMNQIKDMFKISMGLGMELDINHVTIEGVARMTRLSIGYIRNLVYTDRIPFVRRGRFTYFNIKHIQQWMADKEQEERNGRKNGLSGKRGRKKK